MALRAIDKLINTPSSFNQSNFRLCKQHKTIIGEHMLIIFVSFYDAMPIVYVNACREGMKEGEKVKTNFQLRNG